LVFVGFRLGLSLNDQPLLAGTEDPLDPLEEEFGPIRIGRPDHCNGDDQMTLYYGKPTICSMPIYRREYFFTIETASGKTG
jgi:hypothetical protein